jgi:hypothetical protein
MQEVGKVIGKVITGLDKDKKYIYYTIYNETAKGVPFRDHYDLTAAVIIGTPIILNNKNGLLVNREAHQLL